MPLRLRRCSSPANTAEERAVGEEHQQRKKGRLQHLRHVLHSPDEKIDGLATAVKNPPTKLFTSFRR